MHLNAADLHDPSGREHLQRLTGSQSAVSGGSGHDGAEAADAERPVDGHAKHGPFSAWRHADRRLTQRLAKLVDPCARDPGGRDDGRLRPGASDRFEKLFDVERGELHQVVVHEVGAGERHHEPRHGEHLQNLEVLSSLGHHPLLGGDHQQADIHASGTGDHRAHELFVAGDVHDPDAKPRPQVEGREPEHDRDAPLLLLAQSIGVHPRECSHQSGLAVIDVTCGAYDYGRGARAEVGRRDAHRPGLDHRSTDAARAEAASLPSCRTPTSPTRCASRPASASAPSTSI